VRVAFVDQTGDEAGGAQNSLALLLKALPSQVEPRAVVFDDGTFAERIRSMGIPTDVVRIGSSVASSTRERPRVDALAEVASGAYRIAKLLRAHRIEVVHSNTVKSHVVGASGAKLAGIPAVAHLRDILSGVGRLTVRSALRAFTEERIAISKAVSAAFDLRKTTVIANPLDLSEYHRVLDRAEARRLLHLPDDGTPIVAIVGRINRWKGQDRFLRAVALANRTRPIYALIVGAPRFRDADFLPELQALVRALGLEARVRFLDWVDDMRLVYSAIDLHVNASEREPFGRTTIESAAMGVPTVCFDDSGVSEWMIDGDSGIVVRAADESALASGIVRYSADEPFRLASGSAAEKWSRIFDSRAHASAVVEILDRARRS
jgi:glycosyltransferase involved in cell wall biosynthesis